MIPSSVVGLLLFVACLGPGYVYVRLVERSEPRADRSTLHEAVEFLVVGAVTSTIAVAVVLIVARYSHWLDPESLGTHTRHYVVVHPIRASSAVLAVLVLSYGGAALAALAARAGKETGHKPGSSAWMELLRTDAKDPPLIVTVEMRDGRKVSGYLHGATAGVVGDRELALKKPIAVTPQHGSAFVLVHEDFLILREQDVVMVTGHSYFPREASPAVPA